MAVVLTGSRAEVLLQPGKISMFRLAYVGAVTAATIISALGHTPASLDGTGRLTASEFPVSLALTNGASFAADADLDYTLAGTSGFYTDYDCKAAFSMRFEQSENLASTGESGAIRDGLVIQHIDKDNTAYSGAGRLTVSHAARILMNGSFAAQEKDLVGLSVAAIGRIEWGARGLSGITCDVVQLGSGIGSSEFIVQQPTTADTLSLSIAAVQAVVRQWKGASDGSHIHRCFLAQNDQGYAISSALQVISSSFGGSRDGSFGNVIDLSGATANNSALKMAGAGSGATVIEYDTNDYTSYDRSGNVYNLVIGGGVAFSANSAGPKLPSYTVAGAPSASTAGAGTTIYVSNEAGGAVVAFSDGTNWRRVTDRAVVS